MMLISSILPISAVNRIKNVFCCLFLFVGLNVNATTITVTDNDLLDNNSIVSVTSTPDGQSTDIYEDYNEKYLVLYPSHDGHAIVNAEGGFFDKTVEFIDATQGTLYGLNFYVTNTTPWDWSDYHFEFWDSSFTRRLAEFPVFGLKNDQFLNEALVGMDGVLNSVAEFWDPVLRHSVGETGFYTLQVNLFDISAATGGSFGIRQVATTPEPGTVAILGIGAVAFLMFGRRRRSFFRTDCA